MTTLPQSSGLVIAAPSSGSGKTTLTLGILRAMARRGVPVTGAKCGPDYIDPRFHEAACGRDCFNLDAFAMTEDRLRALADCGGPLVVEGVMGLFDGSAGGKGATADLARSLGLPVVMVVDAARMAQSVAPLVAGFAGHDPDVRVAGVILNNVGSDRHEVMLREALNAAGITCFGAVRRNPGLAHPARHLGLVQATERGDLDSFIAGVADHIEAALDLDALLALMTPIVPSGGQIRLTPPAQRIAIASDAAFAFAYPHLLADWCAGGAELTTFSPLADAAPAEADMIFLPGGYPELHAGRLASNETFKAALRRAAASGTLIYGECGGYMTLGDGLVDADGTRHEMLGLLRLETSFAKRKLHLGYRHVTAATGPFAGHWAAHEFHYASTLSQIGTPLFTATDGWGAALEPMGLVDGNVSGSFAHLIDQEAPA